MIILRIKQIECVGSKPSSPMRSIPEPNKGNSSPGGLCIAYILVLVIPILCLIFEQVRRRNEHLYSASDNLVDKALSKG
jgi:hypothetical protein